MKLFSILGIIISTLLIGYFFIVGLPELARIEAKNSNSESEIVKNITKTTEQTQDFILLDKCNTAQLSKSFSNASEADAFLQSCLSGNETSSINVIKNQTSEPQGQDASAAVILSTDDLKQKCRSFMEHAKFDTQKSADDFLKNCLAGK